MIVPSGVLVPSQLAATVGGLAAAQLRREPVADPDLLRVVSELLSADLSVTGQFVDRFEPVEQAAVRLGVHPRTVRRRARAGEIPATKVGQRWLIEIESEPLTRSSRR